MDLSPWHQIKKGQPPTLVLHGEKDPTVKFWTAKVFVEKSSAAGNQRELAAYPGEAHGFFNYGRVGNKMFIATMQRTDVFFKQLGWLRGKPTIEQFTAGLSKGR